MKRLFLLLALFLLCACSSSTTTTCKNSQQDVQTVHTYTSTEDAITRMKTVNSLHISNMETAQVEQIKEAMENNKERYSALTGVVYTITYDTTMITEEIIIDCEKADVAKLNELHFISKSGDGKDNIISLKQTIANMKVASFTCE